jgi:hypothetical protein
LKKNWQKEREVEQAEGAIRRTRRRRETQNTTHKKREAQHAE